MDTGDTVDAPAAPEFRQILAPEAGARRRTPGLAPRTPRGCRRSRPPCATWTSAAARAPAPAVTVAAVPAALGARLAPYQRDGVAWILGHLCGRGARSCILADAPGLGRTVQAIAAVAALVARGAARRVLVVAPAGVVGVWEAEFARFAGDIAVAVAGDGDRAAARAVAAPGRLFDRLADVGVNVGPGGRGSWAHVVWPSARASPSHPPP